MCVSCVLILCSMGLCLRWLYGVCLWSGLVVLGFDVVGGFVCCIGLV